MEQRTRTKILLAGGALLAVKNAPGYKEAKADTELSLTLGNSNGAGGLYATAPANDIYFVAGDWNTRYYPTTASGIKINGVDVADHLYPTNGVGNQSLVKYNTESYYFDIGSLSANVHKDDVVTFSGTWAGHYNDTDISFTLNELTIVWSGSAWLNFVNDEDLEDYDVITLRDAGIFEHEQVAINTEDVGRRQFNTWKPSANNTHYNFEFSFILQTYTSDAMAEFCVRIGSSNNWVTGHYIQSNVFTQYSTNGVITCNEMEDDVKLWGHGDVSHNFQSSTSLITIGNVRLKNGTQQATYMKIDGTYMFYDLHSVSGSKDFSDHIGIYHDAADCSVRNAWAEDYYNLPGQVASAGETTAGAPNGVYFDLPVNDAPHGNGTWGPCLYYAVDRNNILINGQPFYGYKLQAIDHYNATHYYLKLSDYSYTVADGGILTIRGHFRGLIDDVLYDFYVQPTSFKRTGSSWVFYDIGYAEESAADNLEAGNLISNIGLWRPDHQKNAVKGFDQDADHLVYKKDKNGRTGIWFTSSDATAHGEFRVYMPDNGYKTETKGYAMTQFSFDYMLSDVGVATETGRNHSLTSDGQYIPDRANYTNKFTLQVLCHHSSNMYFDIDLDLVNDGMLHTYTLNLAYPDVMGFCFVIWNFDGTFLMSNCHANYLEYNQTLDEFCYSTLKMYDYVNANESCLTYYPTAKAAYEALSNEDKALFNTHAAYGAARARLAAWAIANSEVFDSTNGTLGKVELGVHALQDTSVILIVVASAIALSALAGIIIVKKKHQK